MDEKSQLEEFYNFWENVLSEQARDIILEFAATLSNLREAFENQSEPIKLHILCVQLYGYESTAIQTIYDIYDILYGWNERPSVNYYLRKKENIYKWFAPLKSNDDFKLFYRRKLKTLRDKYINKKPNLDNIDYSKVNLVFDYISELISNQIYIDDDHRQEFYDKIRKILGV